MSVFETVPLAPALGAEIRGLDLRRPLPAATVADLRAAWLRHIVLLFRGQRLSDNELIAFARQFGELDDAGQNGPYASPDNPDVLVVSNVVENGKATGVLGDGEAKWHTDRSFVAAPPAASVLHALEIPPQGGDTWYMNMYAALDALPPALRDEISGQSLNHDASRSSDGAVRRGYAAVADVSKAPGQLHPLIRVHPETGRPALYLGRRLNAWVAGMSVEESEALLDRVWAAIEDDESLVYRHRWALGDLLMWDNRCAMHRRDAFDPAARRVMHRTELAGGPVEAAAPS